MHIPDAAVGSIVAAAIGGLVVFISTVLSKEQKTSEFRQNWIDELRKDISDYISGSTEVVSLSAMKKKAGGREEHLKFIEENLELIQGLQTLEYRILLRLNRKEHANLIRYVRELRPKLVAAYERAGTSRAENLLVMQLTDEASRILKTEWTRVKNGEPGFRFVKAIAILISIALPVGLVLILSFQDEVPTAKEPKQKVSTETERITKPDEPVASPRAKADSQ